MKTFNIESMQIPGQDLLSKPRIKPNDRATSPTLAATVAAFKYLISHASIKVAQDPNTNYHILHAYSQFIHTLLARFRHITGV